MEAILQTAVDLVPCDYCGALRGEPCATSSGTPYPPQHQVRVSPLRGAYYDGWRAGAAAGYRGAANALSGAFKPSGFDTPQQWIEKMAQRWADD